MSYVQINVSEETKTRLKLLSVQTLKPMGQLADDAIQEYEKRLTEAASGVSDEDMLVRRVFEKAGAKLQSLLREAVEAALAGTRYEIGYKPWLRRTDTDDLRELPPEDVQDVGHA